MQHVTFEPGQIVHVRRTSGELEAGWRVLFVRHIDGAEYARVRAMLGGLHFVEKDVLTEALAMWQEDAHTEAAREGEPLLPTMDRLDIVGGFEDLLRREAGA